MSLMYCEICDKQIDTDYDAEHMEEHEIDKMIEDQVNGKI